VSAFRRASAASHAPPPILRPPFRSLVFSPLCAQELALAQVRLQDLSESRAQDVQVSADAMRQLRKASDSSMQVATGSCAAACPRATSWRTARRVLAHARCPGVLWGLLGRGLRCDFSRPTPHSRGGGGCGEAWVRLRRGPRVVPASTLGLLSVFTWVWQALAVSRERVAELETLLSAANSRASIAELSAAAAEAEVAKLVCVVACLCAHVRGFLLCAFAYLMLACLVIAVFVVCAGVGACAIRGFVLVPIFPAWHSMYCPYTRAP
jgi:hypothetical protein